MKNLSYILMLATLLVSCSDSGEKVLACVKIGDKWGYINPKGEIVIKPQFDNRPGDFSEGLAQMKIGDFFRSKYGYINRKGKIVINPQFDYAWPFSKGLARVRSGDKYGYLNHFTSVNRVEFLLRFGDKYGYINPQGEIVIKLQFDDAGSFSNVHKTLVIP